MKIVKHDNRRAGRNRGLSRWLRLTSLRDFRHDTRGSVAVLVLFFMMVMLGVGVLAVDFGRMVVLRSQLQNAADAAALAAAAELDGAVDSRDHATNVATSAASQTTKIVGTSTTFTVDTVTFYSTYIDPGNAGNVVAIDDNYATVVEVVMNAESLNLVLQPILDIMTGNVTGSTTSIGATAAAEIASIACEAPPLMMCNPFEVIGGGGAHTDNINDTEKFAGIQFIGKQGTGGVGSAPGEFGVLCTPEGDCGANDIADALAESGAPSACLGPTVQTSPGVTVNKIVWSLNTRFNETNPGFNSPIPSPNIVEYEKDNALDPSSGSYDAAALYGAGDWDPNAYWEAEHPDWNIDPVEEKPWVGGYLPSPGGGGGTPVYPTRYQIYLWEIGAKFAYDPSSPNMTFYPVNSDISSTAYATMLADGYTSIVDSLAVNSGYDAPDGLGPGGTPTNYSGNVPVAGRPTRAWPTAVTSAVNRRLLQFAVLECDAQGVAGNGDWEVYGTYLEMFLTEALVSPSDGGTGAAYFEYIGPVSAGGKQNTYVQNVKLIY